MDLLYSSTRNSEKKITASQAILKGLADDGGLFVPESIPALDVSVEELSKMSYQQVAYEVMKLFLTDFTEEELKNCINRAYDSKFDTTEIAPLKFADGAYYLELFHGSTIAFKDMALSILPHLLITSAKKNNVKNEIVILTATSGDTGKAAMAGFADVEGTQIIVFYPKNGVSPIQEKQMLTQKGANTHVVGIHGNFDQAQSAVKAMFNDKALAETMDAAGYQFSSANSINIGRLVPQIVYYVYAYSKLFAQGAVAKDEKINIVVPTGNFGNILAKDLLGSEDDAEFTYVEAASRVEYLQSAKVDVILANFTVTDDRAEKVDFALPYMKVALGVVSPDDALIKDVKDLEGKKLIVVKGTTAETYFTDNYPDIELVKFDEYQEAYDALLDGRGDAFSTDNTEVLAWAQQNEGFSVGIESLGDIDTIAPAVQKGNTDLLNAINDEIKSLADEQFFHKDFEETLKPVYGDNINPDDLVVEGGVVDSEEKAEDADAAETEDSDAASDDTKDAETTEEPEETEAADAE